MNRQELIEIVAQATGQSQRVTNQMLAALIDTVQSAVANGEKVSIMGFGSFEAKQTAERTGRDIRTGEPVTIPASMKPKFTPGANFRDAVKGA